MTNSNDVQDWNSASPTHWSVHTGPVITHVNRSVYITVSLILGLIVVISLCGMIWLSYLGKNVPEAVIALGSVAVGALGSLFTHK